MICKKHTFACLLLVFTIAQTNLMGQKKLKTIKNPVGWSYTISPKTPLDESFKSYAVEIDTDLNPMDWWEEIEWSSQVIVNDPEKKAILKQEAIQDTLNKWGDNHLAFHQFPYIKSSVNPDFIIKLTTEHYSVENVQLDVDFSDMESSICEVNARARLSIISSSGEVIMNHPIIFYVDEENQSTRLPIKEFMLNPVFKMKYSMKKKPEKKRKLLQKKLNKYESDVLEYFFIKSGEILREHFLNQKISAYAATFGIKNNGHEALNDASNSAKTSINALSSLSKKKKKGLDEVKSEMEIAISYWQDKLERTDDSEIQKLLCANLALAHLILGNLKESKDCLYKIPESEHIGEKMLFQGGFNYYLNGLSEAIAIKERYGNLAKIK